MDIVGLGKRVQIFLDGGDTVAGKSLHLAIMERLHAEGAAGATVTRGIAGFGAHSRIHTTRLADIISPLPLVITWIDAPDRVERLLPMIGTMVREGLITVEDVSIVKYSHRDLSATHPTVSVSELMTRDVTTVQPDTPLVAVVDTLVEQELRATPVVSEDRLVGLITNSDLTERGGLPARLELLRAMEPGARHQAIAGASAHRAADVMTTELVTIGPDDRMEQAAEVMRTRGLKRLPVVDSTGCLLGIISRVDVLRALGESYPAPDDGYPTQTEPARVVGDVMSHHAPVVREDARLTEVLDAVVSTRLNRAVVIDSAGHPQGVISDADVLRRLDPRLHAGLLANLMRRSRAVTVPEEAARTTAGEMMSRPALTVTPDTPLEEAARRMVDAQRKVLVVVDAQGGLLGIVDRAHLLAAPRPPEPGRAG